NDVVFLVAAAGTPGGVTPAGSVTFRIGNTPLGTAPLTGSGGTATATLSLQGTQLPVGSGTITASLDEATTASLIIQVSPASRARGAAPRIDAAANGASFKAVFAPGMILTLFGSNLANSTESASSVPLPKSMGGVAVTINGIAAPLYYISPTQLNVQI